MTLEHLLKIENWKLKILLTFLFSLLIFNFLPNEAEAGLIVQRPLYIGLTSGLVGYWSFDGPDMAGNTAYDRSGQGNTGTLTNGPVRTLGKIGQALEFDGANDYVNMGDVLRITNISISVWIKQLSSSGWTDVVNKGECSSDGYALRKNDSNNILFEIHTSAGCQSLSTAVAYGIGQWTHVVATYDGSTMLVYKNGVQIGANPVSGAITYTFIPPLVIASDANNRYLNAILDDVRIYNRALSPDEIKRLYKIGSTLLLNKPAYTDSLQNGLVGFWSFDGPDMSGNTAFDRSGQGNNGTLTNGPVRKIGRIGQGLFVSGNNEVDINNSSTLSGMPALTVAAWIKLDQNTTDGAAFFNKRHSVSPWNSYLVSFTKPFLRYEVQVTNASGGVNPFVGSENNSVVYNQWQHVVMVYDGANVFMYIDGVQSGSTGALTGNVFTSDDKLYIMGSPAATGAVMGGDEFRIYNRALSPDEIKRLYKIGSTLLVNKPAYTDSLQNGLVGFWSFDGPDMAGNTAYDRSGQGNNGTLTNGPTRVAGKIGQALEFDGVNDYVTIASNWPLTTGLTVTAWMMKTRNVSWSQSIVQRTGANFAWNIGQSCSSEKWGGLIRINPTTYCVSTTFAPLLNTWYFHVLRWKSGDYLRHDIYNVDGTVAAQLTSLSTITGDLDDATAMDIGASAGESSYSPVRIDDVRVYNRALSPDEIKRLYNMGR